MRYLFLLALLVLALHGESQAQTGPFHALYSAGIAIGDTLVDQDTAYYYLATNAQANYSIGLLLAVTQLTGTAAGTLSLQVAYPPLSTTAHASTNWFTVSSQTVSGSGTTYYHFERTLTSRRARIQYITPAGTRTLHVKYEGSLMRIKQ